MFHDRRGHFGEIAEARHDLPEVGGSASNMTGREHR
jgi:hypothetical protein